MAYSSKSDIENMFGITIPNELNAFVANLIAAVQIYIDRYCGRTFEGASATRYYEGVRGSGDPCVLLVDPFYGTPSEVQLLGYDGSVEDTLVEGTGADYLTGPENQDSKNLLRLLPTSGHGRWGSGPRRVKVTATFGNGAACPADVNVAATKLAGELYRTRATANGELASLTLGDYSASYQPANVQKAASLMGVDDILDGYRLIEI